MPSRILRLWNPNTTSWEEVGDSRLTTHLAAADPHPNYLLETLADAKGDLFAASAADTAARLPVGTNGQVLTADSAQPLGVAWATPTSGGMSNPMTAEGDVIIGGTGPAGTPLRLALGTTAQVLTVAPAVSAGDLYPTAASPPTFVGTSAGGWGGNRFSASLAVAVGALGWYRGQTTGPAPTSLRLRDLTTNADVATVTPADSGTVGWQYASITPVTLVAGRLYWVAGIEPGGYNVYRQASPVTPDAPFAWQDSQYGMSYPVAEGTLTAESQYSVRVTTGTGPRPAWQTPAGLTQSAADARYLQLTGGQLTGDLVLSEATPTVSLKQAADTQPRSRLSDTALAFGPGGTTAPDATLQRTAAGALQVGGAARPVLATKLDAGTAPARYGQILDGRYDFGANVWYDGTNWNRDDTSKSAFWQDGNTTSPFTLFYAPAGANPIGAALKTFLSVSTVGGLSLTPDPGQIAVYPGTDNSNANGGPTNRWSVVYAVAGTINTSSAAAKQAITPLDPADAMAAVRATDPVVFDYRPPERDASYYELPDDPEQAEAVLYQRMIAAPLEAGARRQAGFVLGSPDFHTDPLFETGSGQSSPQNSVGVLIGALRSLDQRLTAIETP